MSTTCARRCLVLLTSALLAALALLAFTSGHNRASASPYPPVSACAISTADQSVQPGDTISINGSGFAANSTVTLTLHSATIALGTVHTDGAGSFTDKVTIPSSLTGSNHTIVASSASVTCSFDPFGDKGVDAVTTTPRSGTDGLATTGFASMTASGIAVALVVGGGLLLLLGRRHRQP